MENVDKMTVEGLVNANRKKAVERAYLYVQDLKKEIDDLSEYLGTEDLYMEYTSSEIFEELVKKKRALWDIVCKLTSEFDDHRQNVNRFLSAADDLADN
jgi:hypothetical protein